MSLLSHSSFNTRSLDRDFTSEESRRYGILTNAHVANASNAELYQPTRTTKEYKIGDTIYFLDAPTSRTMF